MHRYQKTSDLPAVIPVFPLAGALLLPRTELPLNIFEPRYVAMVEHAMAGDRIIGMIQPVMGDASDVPALTTIGCAGRVGAYAEVGDGRLQISLFGIMRFEVEAELDAATPFRRVRANYRNFAADLVGESGARLVDRGALISAFRQYLEANNMSANWDEVERVSTETLVNTLSQLAPYPALEKQALLEAENLQARAEVLIALTELSLATGSSGKRSRLQ